MKPITVRDMLRYRASYQQDVIKACKQQIKDAESVMSEAKRKFREVQRMITVLDKPEPISCTS